MFKSLIKVFGLIFGAFSNASTSQQESAPPEQDDQAHTPSNDNSEEDSLLIDDLEVSEVDPLGDWGRDSQRVSSLFLRHSQQRRCRPASSNPPHRAALPDIKVPSPEQFFGSRAELQLSGSSPLNDLSSTCGVIDDSDIIHPQAAHLTMLKSK